MIAIQRAEQAAPQILAHYKNTPQIYKAIEEMGELTQRLSQGLIEAFCSKDKKVDKRTVSAIQEEVADVLVTALQMRCLFGATEVDTVIAMKIERTFSKIKEAGSLVFQEAESK